MCSRYDPVLNKKRLETYFGVTEVTDIEIDSKPSLWPGYVGPFIRKHEHSNAGDEAVPFKELMAGSFGMIPHWAKDTKIARQAFNARSETAHEKPCFRDAWRLARHCIIPAEGFFEPDWRTGKAVPTRFVRTDGKPLGIAGLWTGWKQPNGQVLRSFTMLTINADDHSLMRNFHKPTDEKRMIVILQDDEYDDWLKAAPDETRYFLRQYPAERLTSSV